MTERIWHRVRAGHCDAAEGISAWYGFEGAFDYALGDRLLTYVQDASQRLDFARGLPLFVSGVRGVFSAEVRQVHLTLIEPGPPGVRVERMRQFELVNEPLPVPVPGTSCSPKCATPVESFSGSSNVEPGLCPTLIDNQWPVTRSEPNATTVSVQDDRSLDACNPTRPILTSLRQPVRHHYIRTRLNRWARVLSPLGAGTNHVRPDLRQRPTARTRNGRPLMDSAGILVRISKPCPPWFNLPPREQVVENDRASPPSGESNKALSRWRHRLKIRTQYKTEMLLTATDLESFTDHNSVPWNLKCLRASEHIQSFFYRQKINPEYRLP